jgi:hypothetical protein
VLARLRPGVSMSHAQSEMGNIMVRLDKLHSVKMFPERGWGALITPSWIMLSAR